MLRHLVAESWREIGELRQRSVGDMVQDAAVRLELPIEELLERAGATRERTQLLAAARLRLKLLKGRVEEVLSLHAGRRIRRHRG